MTQAKSDALVVFGATGDLAFKKIFPSLQSMVRRGNLKVPVIGVAKSGWNSIRFGSAPKTASNSTVSSTLRSSRSSASSCAMSTAIMPTRPRSRRSSRNWATHTARPSIWRFRLRSLGWWWNSWARPNAPETPASSSKSPSGVIWDRPRRSTKSCSARSTKARFFASIITWANRPFATCATSASQTRSSSRSGTAGTSRACKSRWQRISASKGAALSTRKRG